MPPSLRSAVLAVAVAAFATAAPAAQADSLVFIKRGDIWLSKPDGGAQRALTRNGTLRSPYRSPSQSDGGTIVALKGKRTLHVLNRRGKRVAKPRIITGRVDPTWDVTAIDVRISPDGGRVAFTVHIVRPNPNAGPGQPSGEDLGTSVWVSSLRNAKLVNQERTPWSPAWVDRRRFLVFTPFTLHNEDVVWVVTVGAGGRSWFQERTELRPWDPTHGSAFPHGDLSSRGGQLAVVRGPNTPGAMQPTSIRIFAAPSLDERPTERCDLRQALGARFAPPSWSPDGRALAWSEDDGLWTSSIAPGSGDCGAAPRLIIRGAGQPDWGPAGVPRGRG